MMRAAFILVLLLSIGLASAQALDPAPVALDPTMEWIRAAGFPTWAGVLLWLGLKLIAEIRGFTAKLDSHITQTERRLSRLEAVVFMHRPPGHFTDDPLPPSDD